MNVLVVGAGSIGARRARIAASLGHNVYVSDVDEGAACVLAAEIGGKVREPNADADVALVCTPPETHAAVVTSLALDALAGLYVEKPLEMDRKSVQEIMSMADLVPVTMGACNMRFALPCRPPQATDTPMRWVARMGQAAEHWSPTHQPVSMILDSIHELDLLAWCAGPITRIKGKSDRMKAAVVTRHENGDHGRVELNRLDYPPHRSLRAWMGTSVDWHCDLWPPDMTMYEREMQHLFSRVDAGVQTMNPIKDAAELCGWALEVA
jgi:predicted dehydrogenase